MTQHDANDNVTINFFVFYVDASRQQNTSDLAAPQTYSVYEICERKEISRA